MFGMGPLVFKNGYEIEVNSKNVSLDESLAWLYFCYSLLTSMAEC